MSRGVLFVTTGDSAGMRVINCLIEEAFDTMAPTEFYPLRCTPKDPEFDNLTGVPPADSDRVRRAGEKLYGALVANKDVQDFFALTNALPPAFGQPRVFPLFIRVGSPEAEDLPWEMLWEAEKTFMVLDAQGRWPIARLAAMSKQPAPLHKNIGTSLRLAVVLAAAGENWTAEWESISESFSRLKGPLDVLVLVSDDAAKKAITDAPKWQAAAPARKLAVEYVGDNGEMLINRLCGYEPNIVHIFCHGDAANGPELELETRGDRLAKNAQGSIKLKLTDLLPLASLDWLWLVVLNCCQGAKTAPQLHSIARNLVIHAGVPAVVAMRESIHVDDAHLFAEHFYPDLLAQLNSIFAFRNENPSRDPIEFPELIWVRAVHKARRELSWARQRVPEAWAEWTYPVVYVNRDYLHLHPRQPTAAKTLTEAERLALIAELDVLRSLRDNYRRATDPAAVRERANIDIDIHQIEARLAGA